MSVPRNNVGLFEVCPDPLMGRGNFEGGKGHPVVKYRDTAVPCAKMAEPIEMPFGFYARMGPRNLVRWGPAVLRDVAMTTYFGTQIAKAGFVGYNFGCMIPIATRCLAYLRTKWYLDPSSRFWPQ